VRPASGFDLDVTPKVQAARDNAPLKQPHKFRLFISLLKRRTRHDAETRRYARRKRGLATPADVTRRGGELSESQLEGDGQSVIPNAGTRDYAHHRSACPFGAIERRIDVGSTADN